MDALEAGGSAPPIPRPRTPADVWFGLLRRLGQGLDDRRLTVRGVSFRLEELDFRSGGSAWSFGRLRDVRAVLADVDLDGVPGLEGLRADRVVAECDAVSLGATATASAITLTATLDPGSVRRLLERSDAWVRPVLVDGELRVPWAPGTELVVEPEVGDDGTLVLRAIGVRSFGLALGLPSWLPSSLTVRPELPVDLRLADVWTERGDRVVVRLVLDDPPPAGLERRHVRELMAASRRTASTG